jgi:hypothetical protein
MSYDGHRLEWRDDGWDARMHLDGEPIHAGDALALLTRFGWVRGAVETSHAGRSLTFYFHVVAADARHERYWPRAALALSDARGDGGAIIHEPWRLAWPQDLDERGIRML